MALKDEQFIQQLVVQLVGQQAEEGKTGMHDAERWEQLNHALQEAKDIITQQDEMLREMNEPPNSFGTILSIEEPEPPTVENLLRKKGRVKEGRPHEGRGILVKDAWEVTDEEGKATGVFRIYAQFTETPTQHQNYDLDDVLLIGGAGGTVILHTGEKILRVPFPYWLEEGVGVGDEVLLNVMTLAIIGKAGDPIGAGEIGSVRNIISDQLCEVDYGGTTRVVFQGKHTEEIKLGDRVVLNPGGVAVSTNLGRGEDRWNLETAQDITWGDIGGLENAKRMMREAVEYPILHQEIYTRYNKKPIKGVLLYGPPGCGKTMLGKAAATAVANLHGGTKGGFLYIKGPELLNKWVGETEAQIRSIFAVARRYHEENGIPALIFIDEADAILSKRGSGRSSDMEKTMVPMFLAEMDGLDKSSALVVLATNRSDKLDSAVVRDGRVDRKIKITRPTPESTAEIFALNLVDLPFANGEAVEDLAEFAAQQLFDPKRVLYQMQAKSGNIHEIRMEHAINGGMIVSAVDQATSRAIAREMEAKKESGLAKVDLAAAINDLYLQNADLDHHELLVEVADNLEEEIASVRPMMRGRRAA